MKAFLTKQLNGNLKPSTQEDKEKLAKIKVGEEIRVEFTRPRNIQFHRKYFSLLNLAFDNMPERYGEQYKNVDQLRKAIMLELGRYKLITNLQGHSWPEIESISFANMKQDEFEKVYSETIDVIIRHLLPGNKREEIEREIVNYI